LELRVHGIPEEAVAGHDQRQPDESAAKEYAGEDEYRGGGAEPHNAQTLASTIGEPAPDIGRDHFGGLQDSREHANGGSAIAEIAQIQRPERQPGAEQTEVEKIKGREPRIGNGR